MNNVILLDSGPLGLISHPRVTSKVSTWLAGLVGFGVQVLIPEVADYEVRHLVQFVAAEYWQTIRG
jgi:hypothetical protein